MSKVWIVHHHCWWAISQSLDVLCIAGKEISGLKGIENTISKNM
jgi:hypothetical protein